MILGGAPLGTFPLGTSETGAATPNEITADGALVTGVATSIISTVLNKAINLDGHIVAPHHILAGNAQPARSHEATGNLQLAVPDVYGEGLNIKPIYADGVLIAPAHTVIGSATIIESIQADGDVSPAGITVLGSGTRSKLVSADGAVEAPAQSIYGSDIAKEYVVTPRPPLKLFDADRQSTNDQWMGGWSIVSRVREYKIPATEVAPEKIVPAKHIVSGLILANPTNVASQVSIRVIDPINRTMKYISESHTVPAQGESVVGLPKSTMSCQEILQIKPLNLVETHATIGYQKLTEEDYT